MMGNLLKLRVWDYGLKKMFYKVYSVHFQHYDDGSTCFKSVHVGEPSDLISLNAFKGDKFEVMHSTDIKDKRGKEIYEGDILSYEIYLPGQFIVRFGKYYCDGSDHVGFYLRRDDIQDVTISPEKFPAYEVMGNILENGLLSS